MKLKGIKKVASQAKDLDISYYSPRYLQVNVNIRSGEVWTDEHYDLGHNSWTKYDDENIIFCGIIYIPKSMKAITDMVEAAIAEHNAIKAVPM